jgi:uncharacterized OsmC-like protein
MEARDITPKSTPREKLLALEDEIRARVFEREEEIRYEVEVSGDAPEEQLRALIDRVDEIAEIPNSLRQGTRVSLVGAKVR